MEQRPQSHGWRTFLEHWHLMAVTVPAFLAVQVLIFFISLSGMAWLVTFAASLALMAIGAGLIFRAKFPVYRSGRYLTFGPKSVPAHLTGHYRWGWGVFLVGALLTLGLLLSNP